MKYKIYDRQLGCYAFSEYIFNTKAKAVDQLISFFSADCDGDLTKIRAELWHSGEFAELHIMNEKECVERDGEFSV